MSGHAPTPWTFENDWAGSGRSYVYGANHELVFLTPQSWAAGGQTERNAANAQFAVRAVNAHDELVAALRAYEEWEAKLVTHGSAWRNPPDGEPLDLPHLTQDLWQGLLELQGGRNAALQRADGRP
jgi:hypothetical protein